MLLEASASVLPSRQLVEKMSKRKGMSADDKRRVILKIYHDRKEPFNLKEIELIASKQVHQHATVDSC